MILQEEVNIEFGMEENGVQRQTLNLGLEMNGMKKKKILIKMKILK